MNISEYYILYGVGITSRIHHLILIVGETLMDLLFINRWKIINGIFILGAKFMLWKLGESN